MEKGKVVEWLKKEGEPLLVVETEKVTQEVQALDSGVLRKIIVKSPTHLYTLNIKPP